MVRKDIVNNIIKDQLPEYTELRRVILDPNSTDEDIKKATRAINTDLELNIKDDRDNTLKELDEKIKEQVLTRIALGRFGLPEDVADTVLFLAASGRYITGQVIAVDGSLSM